MILEEAENRITVLESALQADAADLWRVTNAIRAELKSRSWLTDTPDVKEIVILFDDIAKLINQVQAPAQKRFHEVLKVNPFEDKKEKIKTNVQSFLMGQQLVTDGDKYRLNKDEWKRLGEILDGSELKDSEDPYK